MAKICMIAYTFYASDPRVRREAEALCSRGDHVDFICAVDPKQTSNDDLRGVHLYPIGVGRYQGASTWRYLLIYLNFLFKASILVARLFRKHQYDVIHVHTMPDFLVFAALIPKLLGAKIILDVHDLMPELYICKFKKSDNLMVRFITWMERRSVAFAHCAIAVHEPHRQALIAHGNPAEKICVLMNVPDPRIFERPAVRPVRPDSKFRLIYHGTVARRHGMEVALRAIHSLRHKISNFEFLVIGHGDDMARIQKLADELGLEGIVRFQGRVAVAQLPAYLHQADLGVIPLLYDEFTRYMLPLKLMEYVRLGIPAIVSRTETIEAYFDDRMVAYVKPGDIEHLAQAIWDLYSNGDKRSALVMHAARFNAKYNWETQKQTLFALVDSLTGSESAMDRTTLDRAPVPREMESDRVEERSHLSAK
jgi:glycosyltransferase involved in cell wall biosynthesis